MIPTIIHRMYLAKHDHKSLCLPGTGKAVRQFLYAGDFAKIIVDVLFRYTGSQMLICASNTEISISELIRK